MGSPCLVATRRTYHAVVSRRRWSRWSAAVVDNPVDAEKSSPRSFTPCSAHVSVRVLPSVKVSCPGWSWRYACSWRCDAVAAVCQCPVEGWCSSTPPYVLPGSPVDVLLRESPIEEGLLSRSPNEELSRRSPIDGLLS